MTSRTVEVEQLSYFKTDPLGGLRFVVGFPHPPSPIPTRAQALEITNHSKPEKAVMMGRMARVGLLATERVPSAVIAKQENIPLSFAEFRTPDTLRQEQQAWQALNERVGAQMGRMARVMSMALREVPPFIIFHLEKLPRQPTRTLKKRPSFL